MLHLFIIFRINIKQWSGWGKDYWNLKLNKVSATLKGNKLLAEKNKCLLELKNLLNTDVKAEENFPPEPGK